MDSVTVRKEGGNGFECFGKHLDANVCKKKKKKAHQKISTPYETNLRNGLVL